MPIDLTQWLVVVPARLNSSRLPEKPLADLAGKPLIVRVVENLNTWGADRPRIIVATDHIKIKETCAAHQIECEMTRTEHESGTDRCWEVAEKFAYPYILNVQGDEPFINTEDLTTLMLAFQEDHSAEMATLVYPSNDPSELANPNTVKVVTTADGDALYFSRAAIPFDREKTCSQHLQHVGVYAFKRGSLQKFCSLAASQLEQREKLEQLRALQNNMRIKTSHLREKPRGIDTPEDLSAARQKLQKNVLKK